jgi:exopolysaccharide biosynthesis predicted pyruvyltransferase EpsI
MGWKGLLGGVEVLFKPSRAPLLAVGTKTSSLPEELKQILKAVDCPGYVLRSWHMIRQCLAQLEPYGYIFTDRFHGHILCMIRGIPHTVIGNNHHKIKSHWETWTRRIPGVSFADSTDSVTRQLSRLTAKAA